MNTTETKEAVVYFSKQFSGYGHYKLSIEFDDLKLNAVTSNMPLIDRINTSDSECFEEEDYQDVIDAYVQAIEYVLNQNSINYSSVESFKNLRYNTTDFIVNYYPN